MIIEKLKSKIKKQNKNKNRIIKNLEKIRKLKTSKKFNKKI